MSESGTALEEMTRSELEAEVRDLRDDHQQLEARFEAMSTWVENVQELIIGGRNPADDGIDARASVFDELDDLGSAVSNHGEQLEAVRDVGSEKTGKDEKVAAIAAFAQQKVDGSQSKVLIEASEIRGCTGVSRRYAYDLVDTIGNSSQYEWAAVRDARSVTTGSGTANKKKALKVDCGRLRESSQTDGGVNKFTTGNNEEGH